MFYFSELNPVLTVSIREKKNPPVGLPWGLSGEESACQCRILQVQSLVREDPTRCRAAKPVSHKYRACALQALKHGRARAPQQEKPQQ